MPRRFWLMAAIAGGIPAFTATADMTFASDAFRVSATNSVLRPGDVDQSRLSATSAAPLWHSPEAQSDPHSDDHPPAWQAVLWACPVPLLIFLIALHMASDGRSGPLAAILFILAGPILGVLLSLPAAFAERNAVNRGFQSKGKIDGLDVGHYCLLMLNVGLGAAVCATAIYVSLQQHEIRGLRKDWRGIDDLSPLGGPPISCSLQAIGLDGFATLDDVEREYRKQAFELHPDRGGNPAAFKRLQWNYERAKRFVTRNGH